MADVRGGILVREIFRAWRPRLFGKECPDRAAEPRIRSVPRNSQLGFTLIRRIYKYLSHC